MQRKYVETEQVFAKENEVLGEEFQAVTTKLRELQVREAALHTSAAVRYREVSRQTGESAYLSSVLLKPASEGWQQVVDIVVRSSRSRG